MPSFMGRECIITAMPAEVHYDGGSEADCKRIPAVRQRRKKDAVDCTAAQAVAAALLASAMGNTVTAKGPRRPLQEQRKFSALLKLLRTGLT
jgi:hypothetical protein